jgi:hypothetical protein
VWKSQIGLLKSSGSMPVSPYQMHVIKDIRSFIWSCAFSNCVLQNAISHWFRPVA